MHSITDSETLNLVYDLGAGWCTLRLHVRVYTYVCMMYLLVVVEG